MKRLLVAVVALCACDKISSSYDTRNEFSGDPFPILIDDSSGAIQIGVQESGDATKRAAVLDVLSPFTLVDRGATAEVQIEYRDLTVLGARTPGGPLEHPRAQFDETQILTLHPCSGRDAECSIGSDAAPRPFSALVGMSSFSSDALRLDLAADRIFILAGVAGSDERRGRSCDAVLDAPFRGGGTLVIGGTEIGFTNWRVALDACIAPRPVANVVQARRGTDVLFVLSTAIGPSLLSATAYDRYRQLDPSLPTADQLPAQTVYLPSGPVTGAATTLPSLALVSNTGSDRRAPCRQMWASHFLAVRDCALGDDCPCDDQNFCSVPAVVEIQPPGGLPVIILPNETPTLQALRAELRPDRPEVDGILGTSALTALQLDIDYAHDRLLARCVDRTTCGARARLSDRASRSYVNGCLADQPGPIVLDED